MRLPHSRAQAAYVVKLSSGWLRLLSTRLSPICTSRRRGRGACTPRHRPGQGYRAAARAVHDRHPEHVCRVIPSGSANMHSSRISVWISASARILASVSWLGPNTLSAAFMAPAGRAPSTCAWPPEVQPSQCAGLVHAEASSYMAASPASPGGLHRQVQHGATIPSPSTPSSPRPALFAPQAAPRLWARTKLL